jgi:EAL domain-containing protein (putative c-di-GMP-specific phosphodiesterase class I)
MPIDVLKLDRSFIAGLDDPRERGIVGATVSLGHCLELVTIGEGVETAEQAVALRDSGCRFGQGFWWARPMEGDQVAAFAQAAAAVPAAVYSA